MTMFNQSFVMMGGNSRNIVTTVTNENNQPVNLTNLIITFIIKDSALSLSKILTKDNGSSGGITITDAENGKFIVTLLPSDTINLGGNYYYDIELTDGTNIWTVSVGTITVIRNVVEN